MSQAETGIFFSGSIIAASISSAALSLSNVFNPLQALTRKNSGAAKPEYLINKLPQSGIQCGLPILLLHFIVGTLVALDQAYSIPWRCLFELLSWRDAMRRGKIWIEGRFGNLLADMQLH
jgi:hypothetical protein